MKPKYLSIHVYRPIVLLESLSRIFFFFRKASSSRKCIRGLLRFTWNVQRCDFRNCYKYGKVVCGKVVHRKTKIQ